MNRYLVGSLLLILTGVAFAPLTAEGGLFRRRTSCQTPTAAYYPAAAVAEPSQVAGGYRSFSYEPSQPATVYSGQSGQGHRKSPWEYPKTDPRRYD